MVRLACCLPALALAACAAPPAADRATLQQQVADTERAFAATMARRDHAAFTAFLADETVWFTPRPVRGKAAVAADWRRFYEAPQAPFSWEPAEVEVLESGTLALSSGPVRDPAGRPIGTYTSVWRLEKPGVWKVVFDKGCPVCPGPK